MQISRFANYRGVLALAIVLLLCGGVFAGVTASISGTVKDATGAFVVGAKVTATNTETGIVSTQPTNGDGYYSFQSLALGRYDIEVQQTGFKLYRRTGVVLDVNAALVIDVTLQVGQLSEKVEVSSEALHVETANTQMGEVIEGSRMTAVPLVSRSYTDLLALQPGVVSQVSTLSGAYSGVFTSAGFALPQLSGDLNSGAQSVNGMREAANGFILNGAMVQEPGFGGTAVIPNLDSIAEFRILTNNFDSEYGNYSGGQINVITKSGTNDWHGNAFEFLRNTGLNTRNFFDPAGKKGAYHQNQFGGTFGGPIKKDKLFFFADYQGNRKVVGQSSGLIHVPSAAELGGDFSALASQMTCLPNPPTPCTTGTVNGAFFAQTLQSRLQQVNPTQTVNAGESYFFPGCTISNCVFPGAQIPSAAFDTVSKNILALNDFPTPTDASNPVDNTFSTSGQKQRLTDNKLSGRVDAGDAGTRWGMISGYYYFDNYSRNDPFWAGAPAPLVPGFNVLGKGRTEVANIGDTKTLGSSSVNELRLEFQRLAVTINQPSGGAGKSLSSLGFTTGGNTGLVPLNPIQGVPELDFNNFVVGVPSRILKIFENTYQVLDNFSKVIGTHTIRFGGTLHYTQMTENLSNVENGNFEFGGLETGIDFADFLIGAPTKSASGSVAPYIQGQGPPSYGRSHYAGLFGQDSWRVRSNLTLNYGLRWEFSTPWSEKYNTIQTLVVGEQSLVFPAGSCTGCVGSPTGWVFPGDPGIPSSLAPTRYNNFAPRIGLAYSPNVDNGFLHTLLGDPGKTSIRLGYGIFYTTFEGATNFNEIADAPFGNFYSPPFQPSFDAPFQNRTTGNPVPPAASGPVFPVAAIPHNLSAKNPDNSVNWAQFLPLSGNPGFGNRNRLPYAENYELSIQRQIASSDLLTVSYVGTQGHRLLSTLEANPGNPALCLSVSQAGQVFPGTATCGPGGETAVYTTASGQVINGTRAPFGINFASDGLFVTSGNSNYNSLQVNWRHTSGRAQTLLGYTFSKAIDDSSAYGEQFNPVNARLSRGLSAFDATHNFVFSYNYNLPLDKLGGPKRLTNGWAVSGITRFSTGLPVTLIETDDHSLLGTSGTGPIPLPVDTPNFAGGSLGIRDPRSSPNHTYFNTALFSASAIGQEGTANRRFFHGPGTNNWNVAFLKDTHLTERLDLQFRAEFFNIFNHAQFGQPDGRLSQSGPNLNNINSNFGTVTTAADPRIGQLSLKLNF
jgi:carboxypeptidase family protein